jgi:hypothetical protein
MPEEPVEAEAPVIGSWSELHAARFVESGGCKSSGHTVWRSSKELVPLMTPEFRKRYFDARYRVSAPVTARAKHYQVLKYKARKRRRRK